MAYQGLEAYEEAMVAYADGLVSDPKQGSMLHGLIEVMLKSPYRGTSVCVSLSLSVFVCVCVCVCLDCYYFPYDNYCIF